MDSRLRGKIVDVRPWDQNEDHHLVEVELDGGNRISVVDQAEEVSEEMVGSEKEFTLMCQANTDRMNERPLPTESESQYCLISGEVIDKGRRNEIGGSLNIVNVDTGEGEILVHFDNNRGWREVEEGDNLRVLAEKIVLLETAS
ncbi:MAG: hypothetical protein ABEK01_02015 [Candidatus Nanohaloarchaea archaeon]